MAADDSPASSPQPTGYRPAMHFEDQQRAQQRSPIGKDNAEKSDDKAEDLSYKSPRAVGSPCPTSSSLSTVAPRYHPYCQSSEIMIKSE